MKIANLNVRPLTIFLVALVLSAAHLEAATKPNIIYILADDLGYGDLGCFGQRLLKTPNIDRLAAEGMRLTRHYAGSTVCAPSRCVLLTGLHTGHCTVRGNGPGQLKDDDITVAEVLKKSGYTTGCFGKWGVGSPPPLDDPARQGFDEFYGYVNMYHAHNFYPEFLVRNGVREKLRNVLKPRYRKNQTPMTEGVGVAKVKLDYAPDLITAEALKFIEANYDKRFFLYFALNVPHANNEGGGDPEQRDGMEVPDYGRFESRNWPNPEKGFAAMMRNIDRDVGRVLDKLKVLGLDKNTLVIFSSDNGPHQEGRHQMEFFDSNGALRGMKRDLFDGGVRVPTIARWPGKIAPGTSSDHLSGFQDLLATCAELTSVEAPPTDGLSFLPTLLGETEQQKKHPYLDWEFPERGGKTGIVTERWKVIQLKTDKPPAERPPILLFDLETDVSEQRNVAPVHPDVVRRLSQLMRDAHRAQ